MRLGHELNVELLAPALFSYEVIGVALWRLSLPENGRRSVQIFSKKSRWKARGSLAIEFQWVCFAYPI